MITESIQSKFENFSTFLSDKMIERDEEINAIMIALLCRQHVCLVSAPGTAKSMIMDSIAEWVHGSTFNYILNKFTLPEELFGPIKISEYKNDNFVRSVDGRLPTATVAVLDEVFKGNSAILNTMLRVLNERRYRNGHDDIKCPLITAIGASNEWPTGEAGRDLGALFDRFLIRKEMRTVTTEDGLSSVIFNKMDKVFPGSITDEELIKANSEVLGLEWDEQSKQALLDIIRECQQEGICSGNRRHRLSAHACQAAAWLEGSEKVTTEHMGILQHILWVDPADQPRKVEKIVCRIAAPLSMRLQGMLHEVNEILNTTGRKENDQKTAVAAMTAMGKIRVIKKGMKKLGESHPKVKRAIDQVDRHLVALGQQTMEDLGVG